MQAISTKWLPTTDTRSSRIKAECERGSATYSLDFLDTRLEDAPAPAVRKASRTWDEKRHIQAAYQLALGFAQEDAKRNGTPLAKSTWLRRTACGFTKAGTYAHVYLD